MNDISTSKNPFSIKTGIMTFVAVACAIGIVVVALYPDKTDKVTNNDQPTNTQSQETSEAAQEEERRIMAEKELAEQDAQVKNAAAAASAAVMEFINNNNGKMPLLASEVAGINQSMSDGLKHPVTGQPYMLVQTEPKDHEFYFAAPRQGCNEDGTLLSTGNQRQSAIQAKLVSGQLYCLEN